jgi:hypothetical protein
VRTLRLESRVESTRLPIIDDDEESESGSLRRLDITVQTRLPALEHFSLFDTQVSYSWTTEHCNTPRDTMGWSRLPKLDFGDERPYEFFETFTGVLPGLKALRFVQSIGIACT